MTDPVRSVRVTAEDLPYLGPAEGLCELVAGGIVREPSPGEEHGWVAAGVLFLLARHVRERGLGRVYAAETGFVLARDPDTVRAPDAAFVSAERLAATEKHGPYFEGAPDLAVEVLSPGNTKAEIAAKVRDFLEAGARAVWVIDPPRRTLTVHRSGRPAEVLSSLDTLDGGAAVPGLRLAVRDVFAG